MELRQMLGLSALGLFLSGGMLMAVSEPKFDIVEEFDGVEIRSLSEYWVVEIEISGEEGEVGNQAFRPLLGYISGGNKSAEKISMTAPVNQQAQNAPGEKIAMTAPVNQAKTGAGKYTVAFVLPAEFNQRTPPQPSDARLKLRKVSARTVASLRYRGTWSVERMAEKRSALLTALKTNGKWLPQGETFWSRYDPPFMPWFLRRNEVQVEVRKQTR